MADEDEFHDPILLAVSDSVLLADPAGPTTVTGGPASTVPMTSEIGSIDRDCDEVSLTGADVAVASRTHVGLRRLIGLHPSDLDGETHRVEFVVVAHGGQPNRAQITRPTHVMSAATTMT
jgi:hypothetical protein